MLPPHELKNKAFAKVLRGYSTAEVDEHIAFIIEKYTELYRENDELERRLHIALAQLDSYKGDEESIRTTLINAQRAGERITAEANERAEVILNATKENCDRILTEFHARIRRERDTLTKLENAVVSFKTSLYQQYSKQIHELEAISSRPDGDDIPEGEYVRKIVENIKMDVSRITAKARAEDGEEALRAEECAPGQVSSGNAELKAPEDRSGACVDAAAEKPEEPAVSAGAAEPEEAEAPEEPYIPSAEPGGDTAQGDAEAEGNGEPEGEAKPE